MAHAYIALNVQRRRTRKAESFHICIHLRLEHTRVRPGAPKARDELVVHGTALMINQLNALISAIVRIAIIHHYIEAV